MTYRRELDPINCLVMKTSTRTRSEIRAQYLEQAGRAKAVGAPVDVYEAAAWLHKTPRSIRRMIDDGRLIATKAPGRWTITWSELNRLTGGGDNA